jgi:hypothetical protein
MDENEHERLSTLDLRHKFKLRNSTLGIVGIFSQHVPIAKGKNYFG